MNYPAGAIGSVDMLLCLGPCTLFMASRRHGNYSIEYTGKVGTRRYKDGWTYRYLEYTYPDSDYVYDRSLRDAHILPQNYNDWFAFTSEDAAKNYLYGERT